MKIGYFIHTQGLSANIIFERRTDPNNNWVN